MTKSVYRLAALAACLAFVTVVAMSGCSTEDASSTAQAEVSPGAISLCTGCGQIKGGDSCCAEGATMCACGMVKGSPLCCQGIEPGSTDPVALCASCGHIKGTDMCCQPDQVRCDSCKLVKGSAGCCKIKKSE